MNYSFLLLEVYVNLLGLGDSSFIWLNYENPTAKQHTVTQVFMCEVMCLPVLFKSSET